MSSAERFPCASLQSILPFIPISMQLLICSLSLWSSFAFSIVSHKWTHIIDNFSSMCLTFYTECDFEIVLLHICNSLFLLLSRIPYKDISIFCLSTHLLKGIWVLQFGATANEDAINVYVQDCVDVFLFLLKRNSIE
jgi:hypothetical protein